MDISRIEAIPSHWDDDLDTAFFRVVHGALSAEFLYGAGVLLACNDPVPEARVTAHQLSLSGG